MISVVLYGRNDSYGYNLHKRAALSLNCIAEILTHDGDEILFVDYNTPDDFPTFPEAIQDTLTPRARRLLRILRVRPKHHQRFKDRTHLVALEPVARNVAVRRSNPANRWILSTNTDMIFVPRRNQSLSEIADDLRDGFYHLPRFEVPESLWESLDRADPAKTIAQIEAWGREFHLNEIVHAHDPWVKFDGPGDFQLILRSDLFRISGFHEDMLLGWHVDSNIARRLHSLYGDTGDVLDRLFGYHCDHTRQVTPAHRAGSVQNDLAIFNNGVLRPELPEQAATWGLADEAIEELTAERTSALYVAGLGTAITGELVEPSQVTYAGHTYDTVDYDVRHVLPFITDIFASYPRDTQVGWFGSRRELLDAFAAAFQRMGFEKPVLVGRGATWIGADLPAGCIWMDPMDIIAQASAFVFDCGLIPQSAVALASHDHPASFFVAAWLRRAAQAELARLAKDGALPRRFIAVNAIHNRFESLVGEYINAARSPMASRIRQGFVIAGGQKPDRDLLPRLFIGGAGKREADRIVSVPGKAGFITYGPYLLLDAFQYRLSLTFEASPSAARTHAGSVAVEIFSEPYLFGVLPIGDTVRTGGTVSLRFDFTNELLDAVPLARIEFRILTDGQMPVVLTAARLEEVMPAEEDRLDYDFLPLLTPGPASDRFAGREATNHDLLPLFSMGEAGKREADRIVSVPGKAGLVTCGPYLLLDVFLYRLDLTFEASVNAVRAAAGSVAVEVFSDPLLLGVFPIAGTVQAGGTTSLWFDLTRELLDAVPRAQFEFRIRTNGQIPVALIAARLEKEVPAEETSLDYELLPLLTPGAASTHGGRLSRMATKLAGSRRRGAAGGVRAVPGKQGHVVYGPHLAIPHGCYEARFTLRADESRLGSRRSGAKAAAVEVAVGGGDRIVAHSYTDPASQVPIILPFDVPAHAAKPELLEFRVWSDGSIGFIVQSINVRRVSSARQRLTDGGNAA